MTVILAPVVVYITLAVVLFVDEKVIGSYWFYNNTPAAIVEFVQWIYSPFGDWWSSL